ncbi:AAA family ATPase [Spirosoma aerolatum]|uniref:AAA family ATPase n=1 Tax=Spirosoma aerolatum TaxID=1211326 RepID=UPI0009AC82DC|nr:AAA family ATPase [Spirosoma aerolatum]
MSAPQSTVPLLEDRDKFTHNPNGKKTSIPREDIVKEMELKPPESKSSETDFASILAGARVRPTDTIEEDTACLTIQREEKTYIVGTLGNITTVSGRAKAKKTFAVSFAIAAAVSSTLVLNRVMGALPNNKCTVLLFDTEQSKQHVLKVVKRICRLCGINDPPNLLVYSLRPFAPDVRLKAIDYAINNTPGLGLVVIDGVRDLAIDPVLDAEQASEIMTHLLQWTDRLNIHIMCVLHQNKSDTNLRGHLGTELVNKSETVITVTRDEKNRDISHVKAEYCRNQEFEPFCFAVDETGLPYLIDDVPDNTNARYGNQGLRKVSPATADSMTPENLKAIVERAFSQEDKLAYGQLSTNIIEASKHIGVSLSQLRAREFIQRIVLNSMITKFRPEKAKWDFYKITPDSNPQSAL